MRPTKLTPEISGAIVRAIANGTTAKAAAESAGIDEATFYRWLKRPGPRYRAFSRRIDRARAKAHARYEEEMRLSRERWSADWRARSMAAVEETLGRFR
jgi:transposase